MLCYLLDHESQAVIQIYFLFNPPRGDKEMRSAGESQQTRMCQTKEQHPP
jgi:hypothetical protein